MNKAGQNSYMIAPGIPPADNIHVVLGSEPGRHHLSPAFRGRPSETFFTDILLQELDSSKDFVEVMGEVRSVAGEATKGVQHPACYHVGELCFGLADTNDGSPQAMEERLFHIQLAVSVLRSIEGLSSVAEMLTPKMVAKDRSSRWEFHAYEEKFLDFSGDMLGDQAVVALSTLIQPCCCSSGRWMCSPNAQGINLSANNLTDKGACALASALAPHRNLSRDWTFPSQISSLQLHQNYISDEGCAAVLGVLAPKQNSNGSWVFNSSMRHLRLCSSICNNQLREKTAAALLAVLAVHEGPDGKAVFNNSLTEIELDGNTFSSEAREQIQTALDKLNSARAMQSAVTALRSVGMDSKMSEFVHHRSQGSEKENVEAHMKTAMNNLRKGKDRLALKMTW
uniref:Uncharacterized protein n=1 Tax=Tetraselmis chuii TaxID=63592 RepID=A0A7S1SIK7_9CHLO